MHLVSLSTEYCMAEQFKKLWRTEFFFLACGVLYRQAITKLIRVVVMSKDTGDLH